MNICLMHSDRPGKAAGVIGGSEQVATSAPDRTRTGTDQPAVRAPIALARVLGNRTKLAYFSVQCRAANYDAAVICGCRRRQTDAGVNERPHGHSRDVSIDGSAVTRLGKRAVSPPVAARHGMRLHLLGDYSDVRAEL